MPFNSPLRSPAYSERWTVPGFILFHESRMSTLYRIRIPSVCAVLTALSLPVASLAQEPSTLLEAAMFDDLAAVKAFVEAGADINETNDYHQTPLLLACNYGYEETAEYLISQGADVNVPDQDGGTALIAAASSSSRLVVLLLAEGADIGAKMANGTGVMTRFTIGIIRERVPLELGEILLSHGADVDEALAGGRTNGYTPLMMAARNNQEPLVEFLIEHGADVRATAEDGATPLSLAEDEGHENIVEILKAKGGGR